MVQTYPLFADQDAGLQDAGLPFLTQLARSMNPRRQTLRSHCPDPSRHKDRSLFGLTQLGLRRQLFHYPNLKVVASIFSL